MNHTKESEEEYKKEKNSMEERLNKVLWSNLITPETEHARPMKRELADDLVSFLRSELQLQAKEIIEKCEEVGNKYKGDGLQGSRDFFYQQCAFDLKDHLTNRFISNNPKIL